MSAATIDPAQATPVDASKFTREKKLAALLMVLGSESAAEVLKGLSEQQVAAVTSAMTSLPVIDKTSPIPYYQQLADLLNTHEVDAVTARRPVAIVTVVGAGMAGTPGIAGRLFSCLGTNGINVVAIAQGSSELNISLVVEQAEVHKAVQAIHDAFHLT